MPVIFFVGWLSCDSMEYPDRGRHDGFGILLRLRIDESGYATVRMDKPGAGESQGECAKADSESEITAWPAAFNGKAKYDFTDLDRVFVVGLCNRCGGLCHAPRDPPVRGFISGRSWGVDGTGTGWNRARPAEGSEEVAGRGEHRGQSFCGLLRFVP